MDEFSYGMLKYDAYIPRILDRHVAFALEDFGGVNIRGPKYCGKTWTGYSVRELGNRRHELRGRNAKPGHDRGGSRARLARRLSAPHR